jgi:hypothetical protein
MFGKLLVTAAVIYVAYLVVRTRFQDTASAAQPAPASRAGALPGKAIRTGAFALLALMIGGTLVYLFQDWERRQQVVEVQVVNSYTGAAQSYQARRGDIDRRSFRTLDGRFVRIADMERLVVDDQR